MSCRSLLMDRVGEAVLGRLVACFAVFFGGGQRFAR